MDRYECRKAIVKDLEEQGYLAKVLANQCQPATAATTMWSPDLCPVVREDGASGLVEAPRVVNEGEEICPRALLKTYTNWMENCHDISISRQLWGAHQIPRGPAMTAAHINVKREDPTACESAAALT